ncbi:hypothetical protein [Hugenholtzia roseola]|uniref:hypothetical protein n=1 Tax=Hugenholtzia roseola TaxID=1002 RepID=UPI0003FD363A|nr:hypothetical protein [Hugenholtzia roseola]
MKTNQNFFKNDFNTRFSPLQLVMLALLGIGVAAFVAYMFSASASPKNVEKIEDNFLLEEIKKANLEHLKTIEGLEAQLKEMQTQAQKHKDEALQRQGQVDAKVAQMEAKAQTIDELNKQINTLKDDKNQLLRIIDTRANEVAALTERNKEQNALIKATQDQFLQAQEQARQDQNALKNLQEELRVVNQKYNIAQTHERELQNQVNKLMEDLSQTRTELNQAKIDLNDAKAELRILKEIHPIKQNNGNLQQVSSPSQQTEDQNYALKIVAIVSVIVMFIVFVVYMLHN